MVVVKLTKDMGRGVFSQRLYKKGEIITVCEILELSKNDTKVVNSTDLKWYTFKLDEQRDCLVLGVGEIFNHADIANVEYKLVQVKEEHGTRLAMQFRALSDIAENSQLFIDYTADESVNTIEYSVNMLTVS